MPGGELPPQPKIYRLDDMKHLFGRHADIIQAVSDGFVAYSKGSVFVPPIASLGQPEAPLKGGGSTCVKSGYIIGDDCYVIKVAGGSFGGNVAKGFSPNSGLMMLFSQSTGRLEALLLDEGILTELRTAAFGALAAQLFAPHNTECIGIIGTGVQARYQLRMLKSVTKCRRVWVYGRNADRREAFAREMRAEGWYVTAFDNVKEVAQGADILVTVTTAREPLVKREWVRPGALITCIGADAPGKQELDPELVASADLLVCDSKLQTLERGEFQHAAAARAIHPATIAEIGALIPRSGLHRGSNDTRLIIADSSGVAVQDIQITKFVYDHLTKRAHL